MDHAGSASPRPQRILVVEDNETMAESIRGALSLREAVVEIVPDGLAAWERISTGLDFFDVVVTDHNMPTLSGNELVQLLREAGYAGRIVVYSGALTPQDIQAYRAFGVTDILEKCSDIRALIASVLPR